MLTILGLVIAGLMIWAGLALERDAGFAVFMVGCLVGIVALFLLLPMVVNRLQVGGEMAQIAALRGAAARVDPISAHDIYGQVSSTNQSIAENRWYRRQWWARDFVAAEWDTVASITIPTAQP